MRKKIALSLLFVFVVSLFSYLPLAYAEEEAEILTINEAIVLALENSPEIKQAQNAIDIAYRAEIVKKREKENAHTRVVSTPLFIEALDAEYRMKKQIWELAQDELSDAKKTLEDTQEKVKYNIENQYLTVLNLENQRGVLADSLAFQTKLIKIENLKHQLGLSTALEVKAVQEQVRTTQDSLQELNNSVATLYWNFNRLLGRDVETPVQLAPVEFSPVKYTYDKGEGLAQAKEASLALEQFNRILDNKKEELDDLDSGSSNQARLLEEEMRQLELNIDALDFGLSTGMKVAWDKLELTQKKLLTAKKEHETQELTYSQQQQQYLVGMLPEITLDTSAIQLKQAELNYEKAVYNYYLAARELELAQLGITF